RENVARSAYGHSFEIPLRFQQPLSLRRYLHLSPLPRDHQAVVVAVIADVAHLAQRLRVADPSSMENQRIGGLGPFRWRQLFSQLLFAEDGVVAFGDANPVGAAQ